MMEPREATCHSCALLLLHQVEVCSAAFDLIVHNPMSKWLAAKTQASGFGVGSEDPPLCAISLVALFVNVSVQLPLA